MSRITAIKEYDTECQQHTEEQMALILSHMMELERQIRAAKDAEAELQKCREQLAELAYKYVGGSKDEAS
ncbi:hypothetical protein [Tepidanaerobacter syntrophicus]|uniref:hypothetical protein n=1 Tax=Tepidanaerobacter syntrophicus TaxID=224999 RepID=UPI001BD443D0|nr:hypothetical protein [Tepidanaerobacter syntrophicus]